MVIDDKIMIRYRVEHKYVPTSAVLSNVHIDKDYRDVEIYSKWVHI